MDNAHAYAIWYLSQTAAGAAGEAFGNFGTWRSSMFETPFLPSGRRALAVFEIDDDLPLLDLDNARELANGDAAGRHQEHGLCPAIRSPGVP